MGINADFDVWRTVICGQGDDRKRQCIGTYVPERPRQKNKGDLLRLVECGLRGEASGFTVGWLTRDTEPGQVSDFEHAVSEGRSRKQVLIAGQAEERLCGGARRDRLDLRGCVLATYKELRIQLSGGVDRGPRDLFLRFTQARRVDLIHRPCPGVRDSKAYVTDAFSDQALVLLIPERAERTDTDYCIGQPCVGARGVQSPAPCLPLGAVSHVDTSSLVQEVIVDRLDAVHYIARKALDGRSAYAVMTSSSRGTCSTRIRGGAES